MRNKTISFGLLIFLVVFVFLSFTLQDSVFADCGEYMGEPDQACCMKDDPDTPCCATLDSCNLSEDLCECNTGNSCVLSGGTGGGTFYKVCIPDDIECGEEIGQPCCEEAGAGGSIWVCNHPDDIACNFDTQKCESCGSEGQICCNNSTKCDSGLECYGGKCKNIGSEPTTDCNEVNEICCYDWGVGDGNTCQIIDTVRPNFEDCYCEDADLTCTLSGTTGYCTDPDSCSAEGQVCCDPPLEPCDSGLGCSVSTNLCGPWNLPEPPVPEPPEMVYKGPIIESLEQVIGPVSKMLYYGGLAIGVFFIILSGYKLMTSEGDPQRVKAAQEQLTSAIVGIIFILLSVSIIRIIIEEIIVI